MAITIAAGEFKAKCLSLIDRVFDAGETVVITKRGKPVAQLVSLEEPRPLEVSREIAVTAGSLPSSFPGDPSDRAIYATAVMAGARLVTQDRAIREFDPARTVW